MQEFYFFIQVEYELTIYDDPFGSYDDNFKTTFKSCKLIFDEYYPPDEYASENYEKYIDNRENRESHLKIRTIKEMKNLIKYNIEEMTNYF